MALSLLYKPSALLSLCTSRFNALVSAFLYIIVSFSKKLIKTMVSSGCKRSLSLWAKAIFHLLLILVAGANLVVAARPPGPMNKKPKFGSSTTRFPESNRPVPPSGPNNCSYIPGPGHCIPPK
ncbi:hypothetical protein DKX38_010700 [Salix brachista]|uniref:Transmembrane protein n=1 Tax=Salix brachista TaxID=2182728 RepID=A0A5N5MEC7_9ROSI|nr:hypothetical protein DKX38_010700 [Salix brachista]